MYVGCSGLRMRAGKARASYKLGGDVSLDQEPFALRPRKYYSNCTTKIKAGTSFAQGSVKVKPIGANGTFCRYNLLSQAL